MSAAEERWVLCPVCGAKTRLRLLRRLKALHEGCREKTVVLVSHRKSTMGIADKVYSVEQGRVS